MGRNIKEGLSYFPLDIDFFEDEKVQFLSARFGVKGDGILIRLLCRLYRQGYGLEFNDDIALLFARSVGDINLHGLVKEVVNELLKRGFFDEAVFKRFGLLTSRGIQKRYAKICTDAKRKNWQIPEKFDLLRSKCPNTPEETEEIPEESTQRKEKKSKVKKSKELGALAPTTEQKVFFKNFQNFISEKAPNVGKMKEPFKIEDYLKLKQKYSSTQIKEMVLKMHNYKPLLQKNNSAYLTFLNWIQRDNTPEITDTTVNNVNERLKAAWKK